MIKEADPEATKLGGCMRKKQKLKVVGGLNTRRQNLHCQLAPLASFTIQACEAQNRNQRAYSEAALKQNELETWKKSLRLGHVTV